MVRLWIDAQLSPALAPWLSAAFAVHAVAIRDMGLRDAEDSAIFVAAKSAGLAILTKDQDFVDLVSRFGPPPQVVWLTCGNTSNAMLRTLLKDAWPRVATLLAAGEPLVEIAEGKS